MAMLSVDRLRKSRPYPHGNNSGAVGPLVVTAAAISVTALLAKSFLASPTTPATFNGKAGFIHIVNIGTTNTYWKVGSTNTAPGTAAVGDGEICLPNGGELWLELEPDGTPVISAIADTSSSNCIVTWYVNDRRP
jgi:hypothetical protein